MRSRTTGVLMPLSEMKTHASSHFLETYRARQRRRHPRAAALAALLCLVGILCIPQDSRLSAKEPKTPQDEPPVRDVTVTAYTNIPSCTDSSPNETASSLHIKRQHYWKIIALSRDLAKSYKFGDRFHLWIDGKCHFVEFQDLMHSKHKNRIDLLLPSKGKCMKFGVNKGVLIPVDKSERKAKSDVG